MQPQSGIDYPLFRPSEDIRYLFADFWLAFDDTNEYDGGIPFTPPYHVYWVSGLGCEPVDSPSEDSSSAVVEFETTAGYAPTAVHAADIVIADNDGRIVFDSTRDTVTTFSTKAWGDRLWIYEWRTDKDETCFLVTHTAWTANDSPEPTNYPTEIYPEDAQLIQRTVMKLPKRVRSLTVILDNFRRSPAEFEAGYNMFIDVGATEAPDGRRRTTPFVFNATAGAGLGIYPGCETEPLVIRTVNGIGPNTEGDFYLSATDCYWVRQPTVIENGYGLPTVAVSPGNVPELGLPDADAGQSKTALGWPPDDDPAYAHLQIGNDCMPCCDCPDYVEVADYLNDTRDRYHALGENFEGIRDLYHENRIRWLASLACFHRRPLRIFLQPQICPFLDVVIQFCNQTDDCVTDLTLTADFSTSPTGGVGVEVPGFTFITGTKKKAGRRASTTERATMGGSWPQFTAYFESVEPGSSVNAQFRLEFNHCGISDEEDLHSSESLTVGNAPYAVTGELTATLDGEMLMVSNEAPPPEERQAVDTAEATLECPTTDPATFNANKCIDCQE